MNLGAKKRSRARCVLPSVLLLLFPIIGCPPALAQNSSGAELNGAQLIQFLNQTISWYHQLSVQQQIAEEPDEILTVSDNREIADKAVRLAFDFARAQADILASQKGAQSALNGGGGAQQYQGLQQLDAKLDKEYQDTQAELEADKKKLATASGAMRRRLESEISELQGELALAAARRDAVGSMVDFMNSSAAKSGGSIGLKGQIEALAATVPVVTSGNSHEPAEARAASPATGTITAKPEPSGIWGLTTDLLAVSGKLNTVDSVEQQTTALIKTCQGLRSPYLNRLRALSSKGDQLAAQADAAGPTLLAEEKAQLDALAQQFKGTSAAVIPLSKEMVLLNLYDSNLASWRASIDARYKADLKSLGLRLGILAVVIALLIAVGEVWRRAVLRYVHEARRRHQFLLIRKLSLWFVIVLIIAITLAGKLGSVATFAGLLTAGVALALQNVIVAIAGYFFLIGKYGIRVGDRVQVSGTSGEVIDVGLVRFHLMETGSGGTPTGRVVALSNSVVFQPTAGLFKQIPGAKFAWHEVRFTVPREANFTVLRKTLLETVENVMRDYQEEIERQYRELEKTGILLTEKGVRPRFELRISPTGPEVTIRYPVLLQRGGEIDARMSREIVMALERETELKVTEKPEIQLKTDVPAGG
jgi:small-conductance mechanosensitive channel